MDFRKKFFLVDNPMNILPSMIQNGSVVKSNKYFYPRNDLKIRNVRCLILWLCKFVVTLMLICISVVFSPLIYLLTSNKNTWKRKVVNPVMNIRTLRFSSGFQKKIFLDDNPMNIPTKFDSKWGQWCRRLKYEKFKDDDNISHDPMIRWPKKKEKKITMVDNTLHRKLNIEQHEPLKLSPESVDG
jgi:hypothetical protein